MLLTKNVDASETMVSFTKLIYQLLNGKVILQKLPVVRGTLRLVTSHIPENGKKEEEESDEYFFKEPGKKRASKMSKPFCSKCNQTVDEYKTRDKNCQNCGNILLFKCMTCNRQYTSYFSMIYHLKTNCKKTHLQCLKCDYATSSKQSFSKHIRHMHIESKEERHKKCSKCGKRFKQPWNLKNHIELCKNSKLKHMPDAENISKSMKKKVKSNKPVASDKHNTEYSVTFKNINLSKMIKLCCSGCNNTTNYKPLNNAKNCGKCGSLLLFQCGKCKKRYLRSNSLKYHLKSKCSPQMYFTCSKCDYSNSIEYLIKKHIKNMHTAADPNFYEECSKCGSKLKNIISLRRHVRYCGKEPDLMCAFCPYKTRFKPNLRSHLKIHSKIKNIDVNTLLKKSINKVTKTNNITISRQEKDDILSSADVSDMIREYCSKCDKKRIVNINSDKNCKTCGTSLLFKCENCSRHYNNYNHVVTHVKYSHPLDEQRCSVRCKKCNKQFSKFKSIKAHLKYCKLEATVSCQYCPYVTKYKQNLKSHQIRHHPTYVNNAKRKKDNKIKKVKAIAPVAYGAYIVEKPKVNYISKISDLSKKYCSKCHATFKGETTKSYCPTCRKLLLYQCMKCDKCYDFISSLMYHIRTQCNPKACYNCSDCNYSNSIRALVNRHIRINHPAKRLEECPKCGKGLKNVKSLKAHVSICGTKPHLFCQHCSYSTNHRKKLLNHMNNRHGDIVDQMEIGTDYSYSNNGS